MRRYMMAALALSLPLAMVATDTTAQTAKKVKPRPKARPSSTAADMARMLEGGGAVGCSNGAGMSERAARVSERLRASGNNCAAESTSSATAPARGAQPSPSAGGWYGSADAISVDDSGDQKLTLTVGCVSASQPALSVMPTLLLTGLSLPGGRIATEAETDLAFARERQRLLNGVSLIDVSIYQRDGSRTRFEINARNVQGNTHFMRPITAAELAAIKSARFINVSSARWVTSFTGVGAAKELGALPC